MDTSEFCDRLRAALSPAVYRGGIHPEPAPFALLIKHMNWAALGRYALAVLPWEAVQGKTRLMPVARRGLCRHMFTIPYLWQVGLYLVVPGPSREWAPLADQMAADQTAFHSVIIQAVHFVDLESGARSVSRSQWGPVQFGGTASVSAVVDSILA